MCDCYDEYCEVSGCLKTIPVHIVDFEFPRSEYKVYCKEHLKYAPKNSDIYNLPEKDGSKCAIFSENEEARGYAT
ncbi:hypothetical protein HQ584_01850, partial [Patescibacteria group bacterium]|nr:hypothetical protein [Patescibacteria group bacterium]